MSASTTDRPTYSNPIVRWIEYRLPVISASRAFLVDYPTPRNLSYWWNFGSLAGIALVIQLLTGIVLAMHYTARRPRLRQRRAHRCATSTWLAVALRLQRRLDVLHRDLHPHLRGLYYGSYKTPRELLWILGVVIIL